MLTHDEAIYLRSRGEGLTPPIFTYSLTVYRQNLTMPKFVISGGSDEFFFMDDFWYWWDDMVGEKHLW